MWKITIILIPFFLLKETCNRTGCTDTCSEYYVSVSNISCVADRIMSLGEQKGLNNLADETELRILRWEDYLGLSRSVQHSHEGPYKRETGRAGERCDDFSRCGGDVGSQPKECRQPPTGCKSQRNGFFSRASNETQPCRPILGFWPPELYENKCVSF